MVTATSRAGGISSDAEAAEEFSLLLLILNLHELQEGCEEENKQEAAAPNEEAADAEQAADGSDGPSEAAENASAGDIFFICCIGQGHCWYCRARLALCWWPAAQLHSRTHIQSSARVVPFDKWATIVRTGKICDIFPLIKVRFHIGKRAKTKARIGKAAGSKKTKVPKKGEKAASKNAEVEGAPATPPALEPRGRILRERKPSAVSVRPLSTLPIACACITSEYVIARRYIPSCKINLHCCILRPWPPLAP